MVKIDKLTHSENAWQAKYTALEQEFTKDLIQMEMDWEAKLRQLADDKNQLKEQFEKHLPEKEHSWNAAKKKKVCHRLHYKLQFSPHDSCLPRRAPCLRETTQRRLPHLNN